MMGEISFEEHKIIGMISKILNDKLVGHKKGPDESDFLIHLSKLRDIGENMMFKDYPDSDTKIYYGERPEDLSIVNWLRKELTGCMVCHKQTLPLMTHDDPDIWRCLKCHKIHTNKIIEDDENGR